MVVFPKDFHKTVTKPSSGVIRAGARFGGGLHRFQGSCAGKAFDRKEREV